MVRCVQHDSGRLTPGPAVVSQAVLAMALAALGPHPGPPGAARRRGPEGLLGAAEGAALWRDRARWGRAPSLAVKPRKVPCRGWGTVMELSAVLPSEPTVLIRIFG